MTDQEKAAAWDRLVDMLQAIEVYHELWKHKLDTPEKVDAFERIRATKCLYAVTGALRTANSPSPTLEQLYLALVDLAVGAPRSPMISAPRQKGSPGYSVEKKMLIGRTVAAIQYLQKIEPHTALQDLYIWAVKTLNNGKRQGDFTARQVKNWHDKFGGGRGNSSLERDTIEEWTSVFQFYRFSDRSLLENAIRASSAPIMPPKKTPKP
jgi:hypothetical protein